MGGYQETTSKNGFLLARFHPDGTPDTAFGQEGSLVTDAGMLQEKAFCVTLQRNGRILAAGHSKHSDGSRAGRIVVMRFHPDGNTNSTFGTGGKMYLTAGAGDSSAEAIAVQNDDRIVLAGWARTGGHDALCLARVLADGTPDSGFGTKGVATTSLPYRELRARGMVLQPDGKIAVTGSAVSADPEGSSFLLARFEGHSSREAWRIAHFGAPSNTGTTADFADFDKDGVINLLKYAFGLNPLQGGRCRCPSRKSRVEI